MIQITCNSDIYMYDMYHIVKSFFPREEIRQKPDPDRCELIEIQTEEGHTVVVACIEVESFETKREKKQYVNRKVYHWLSEVTGKELAWGILTGIRPTKLLMKQLEEGKTDTEILRQFRSKYLVTQEKAVLGLEIAKREKSLLEQLDYEEGYSLYVGIPFCPTTCAYCSFTSYPIGGWIKRVDEYLDALIKELEFIGRVSAHKKLNTIYIGGGTPTTLEPEQLDRLLSRLEQIFSYENLKEITVEAGRPDSITRAKLEVLRNHKIGRISINPQTMQKRTLELIGRRHTVEAVKEVYEMAREMGFDNINMDLIAGLPGETVSDMQDTLEQIKLLEPDSLTVHSLALKRASKMGQSKEVWRQYEQDAGKQSEQLAAMIEMASIYAGSMELVPYYMYRQKNIAGNFENVGYAKVDKAGIYNILIMEEKQSIIAAGAGASTKVVRPEEEKRIIRTENVKDIQEYIVRIDEMIERKGELLWR